MARHSVARPATNTSRGADDVVVRVLGPIQCVGTSSLAPKQRAVLGLLAVEAGRTVSIDQLIRALWEDDPPVTAVESLRAHISRLRRVLGAKLLADGRGYRLALPSTAVDAGFFEQLLDRAHAARERDDLTTACDALDEALALWRGEALADVPSTGEITAVRVRLEEIRLCALEERFDLALAHADHSRVLGQLEQAVRSNPGRERLWAQLMRALYRAGRQADALRAFQRARAYLADEIGIEPGLELRRLERSILDQDESLLAPHRTDGQAVDALTGAMLGFPPAGDVVGRAAERQLLTAAWAAVQAGARRFATVTGEPGIGKTSLLVDVAREIAASGGVAVYGACIDTGVAPYEPFAGIVEAIVRDRPEVLVDLPGADHIQHLLPGFVPRPAASPANTPREPGSERFQLFEAMVGLLQRTSLGHPLLVVVDDLHWADVGTVSLLRHLVRRMTLNGALFVAAVRDTEPMKPEAARVIAEVERDADRIPVRLDGLDVDAIEALLLGAGRGAPSPAVATAIHRSTGGNPLLVQQLVPLLADDAHGPPWENDTLPESVIALVARRLDRLPATVAELLRAAALMGPTFDLSLAGAVAGMEDDAALDAVELAQSAGLVQEVGSDRWRFVHDLMRQAALRGISESRRLRMHARTADVIDRVRADDPAWALALARHCRNAGRLGDVDLSAGAFRAAAQQTLDDCLWDEAARWAELALSLPWVRSMTASDRSDVLLSLGRARYATGDRRGYRDAFREAAANARDAGSPERLARAALGFAGWNIAIDAEPDEELALLDEAVAAVARRDDRLSALLLGSKIALLSVRAPRPALRRLLDEAIARARASRDEQVLALVLADADNALGSIDDVEERLRIATELEPLAVSLCDLESEIYALLAQSTALYELGRVEEAERCRSRLEAAMERFGHTKTSALLALGRLTRPLLEGRLAEAQPLIDDAFDAAADSPLAADHLAEAAAHLFTLWWLKGTLGSHAGAVQEALGAAPALRGFVGAVALARAEAGDGDGARQVLSMLLTDGLGGLPDNLERSATLFALSATLERLGPDAPALSLARFLERYEGKTCMLNGRLFLGSFDLHLGWARLREGAAADAIEPLSRSIAFHRRVGALPWLALSEHALGRALIAVGGHDRAAAAALDSAQRSAQELGLRELGPS